MTLKDRLKLIRKAFTKKTTELQREIDALRNAHNIAGGIHFRDIRDLRLEVGNLDADTKKYLTELDRRLEALEGKEPQEEKGYIRNVEDIKKFIESDPERLRLACKLYSRDDHAAFKKDVCQPIRDAMIRYADNLEYHFIFNNWHLAHFDAFYDKENDNIIDWAEGTGDGGRLIDKLNWHIDEWYEEQKVK